MMKKIFFLLTTLIVVVACRNAKKQELQNSDNVNDTIRGQQTQVYKSELIGVWRKENSDESENAAFEITKDSIFYIEHMITYYLKAKKDSIYIYDSRGLPRKFSYTFDNKILVMKEDTAHRVYRYVKVIE